MIVIDIIKEKDKKENYSQSIPIVRLTMSVELY
jgi:hypothetical protein